MGASERLGQDFLSYDQLAQMQRSAENTRIIAQARGDVLIAAKAVDETEIVELYKAASPRARDLLDYKQQRIDEISAQGSL